VKYYLIAGERSGDLHGSNLMKQLADQDSKAEFRFVGGDYMASVAGSPTIHYRQMAFMGFLEVLGNLGTIRKYMKLCKDDILAYKPEAIILIDYAGFNLRIATWARSKGLRVFYYISPKLWAWNSKRALKIKKYVDHMFAIMPFEPEFYGQYDYKQITYVGNPVVDAINDYSIAPETADEISFNNENKTIAVLPGSRKQELKYILPVLIEVIKKNNKHNYVVAAVDNLDNSLYSDLAGLENVKLVTGHTYDLLAIADAALVTSGTATLETAIWDVPQVVLYKGNFLSILIARMLIKVKYISLVNLILDEACVAELIQKECTPTNIEHELNKILEKPTDYSRLRSVLGNHNASENTARGIIAALQLKSDD
jgi:lipid-A-disaccharide synthase